jgi:hypothetical protein
MLQGVVPQAVIVLGHCVTFCTTGVMAVFNQADSDTCGFCTHFRTIAVHAVEQMPFIVTVSIRGHKRAAIAERVKGPDTTAVLITEAVHPGENTGFQRYPLRDSAKVLRPEIRYAVRQVLVLQSGQIRFISGSNSHCVVSSWVFSVNKKRQRRWLAYGEINGFRKVMMNGCGQEEDALRMPDLRI